MNRILFIFAISMFLISCQEETISGFRQCDRMTISDALPVQFWLTECETYNEHEPEGVHYKCWCQPFNCDDEITIQFLHTDQFLVSGLFVKDEDGAFYSTANFTLRELSDGSWLYEHPPFVFRDIGVCDKKVQLILIPNDVGIEAVIPPSSWVELSGAWTTKDTTQFTLVDAVYPPGPVDSYQALNLVAGDPVIFEIETLLSGTITGLVFFLRLTDDAQVVKSEVIEQPITNGTNTFSISLTATGTATRLLLTVGAVGAGSGTTDLTITLPSFLPLKIPNSETMAKSDCLDIREDHPETVLIEYSNQRNYDGLVYENQSPDVSFNIRVPARFYHETEPEEDEGIELTSSTIITSSQVKTQRLLEIKHAPYYFHKKLRRVLKHQSLTIYDKSWKKEEKYDLQDGNMKWPLKSAKCLLTETNSVVRNVM